jgi:hypothetical protein
MQASNFIKYYGRFIALLWVGINGGRVFVGNRELPLSRHRKEELLQSVVYRNLIGGTPK